MTFENGFYHSIQYAMYYQKQGITQNQYFVHCDSFRADASDLFLEGRRGVRGRGEREKEKDW